MKYPELRKESEDKWLSVDDSQKIQIILKKVISDLGNINIL